MDKPDSDLPNFYVLYRSIDESILKHRLVNHKDVLITEVSNEVRPSSLYLRYQSQIFDLTNKATEDELIALRKLNVWHHLGKDRNVVDELRPISAESISSAPTAKPNLSTLIGFNDLLPSPQLRKRLKKMMADQAAHIEELHQAGRYKAARWIAVTTWWLWFWYILKSPVTSLLSAAKRVVG